MFIEDLMMLFEYGLFKEVRFFVNVLYMGYLMVNSLVYFWMEFVMKLV